MHKSYVSSADIEQAIAERAVLGIDDAVIVAVNANTIMAEMKAKYSIKKKDIEETMKLSANGIYRYFASDEEVAREKFYKEGSAHLIRTAESFRNLAVAISSHDKCEMSFPDLLMRLFSGSSYTTAFGAPVSSGQNAQTCISVLNEGFEFIRADLKLDDIAKHSRQLAADYEGTTWGKAHEEFGGDPVTPSILLNVRELFRVPMESVEYDEIDLIAIETVRLSFSFPEKGSASVTPSLLVQNCLMFEGFSKTNWLHDIGVRDRSKIFRSNPQYENPFYNVQKAFAEPGGKIPESGRYGWKNRNTEMAVWFKDMEDGDRIVDFLSERDSRYYEDFGRDAVLIGDHLPLNAENIEKCLQSTYYYHTAGSTFLFAVNGLDHSGDILSPVTRLEMAIHYDQTHIYDPNDIPEMRYPFSKYENDAGQMPQPSGGWPQKDEKGIPVLGLIEAFWLECKEWADGFEEWRNASLSRARKRSFNAAGSYRNARMEILKKQKNPVHDLK